MLDKQAKERMIACWEINGYYFEISRLFLKDYFVLMFGFHIQFKVTYSFRLTIDYKYNSL